MRVRYPIGRGSITKSSTAGRGEIRPSAPAGPDRANRAGSGSGYGVVARRSPHDRKETSEPEPRTSNRFPPTGIIATLLALFAVIAIGLIAMIID